MLVGTLHDREDPMAYNRREILAGLAAGLAVALGLYGSGRRMVYGLHAGTLGVAVNYLVCWSARRLRS